MMKRHTENDALTRAAVDPGQLRVINASGHMTALGGSTLSSGVTEAMRRIACVYCDMERLREWAAQAIADATGAEAAVVVGSASAGIALSVASTIVGADIRRVRQLPAIDEGERRIAIQTGHLVDFGAEIAQMIRLGGGLVLPVGSVNRVDRQEFEAVMRTRPAGFVFVQSHHAVQKGMLTLPVCLEITRRCGVPAIVDAAAEEDLRRYVAAGADLVIYSGAKAFLGPTSGMVCGRRDLVAGVRAQERGIGRAMKIGKESIVGLVQALREYMAADHEATRAARHRMVQPLLTSFGHLPEVAAARVRDEVRPEIERVQLRFEGDGASDRAHQLVEHLRTWRPPIWTRDHRVSEGIVGFDVRPLASEDIPVIIAAVEAFFGA
jgi:D-glucosaminate-6-phosphate ammonia-lyase